MGGMTMKILVVVDMQNDFIDGTLGTSEAVPIVQKVVDKINGFDGEIVATQDTHTADYLNTQEGVLLPVEHCIYKSEGWALRNEIFAAINTRVMGGTHAEVFLKPTFGSVEMAEYLISVDSRDEITEVVLVGLCTDICVISNALLIKAFLPEVKVTVDAACCAGVTPESHANALAAMKMCQINVENWED